MALGLGGELAAQAGLIALGGPLLLALKAGAPLAPWAGLALAALALRSSGQALRAWGSQGLATEATLALRRAWLAGWAQDQGPRGPGVGEATRLLACSQAFRQALATLWEAWPMGLGALCLSLSALAWTSPRLLAVAVLGTWAMAWTSQGLGRWVAPSAQAWAQSQALQQGHLVAWLLKRPLWKAARRASTGEALAEAALRQHAVEEGHLGWRQALLGPSIAFAHALAIALLVLVAAWEVAAGRLELGAIGALVSAVALAIDPALALARAAALGQGLLAAWPELLALRPPSQPPGPPEAPGRPLAWGDLRLEGAQAQAHPGGGDLPAWSLEAKVGARLWLQGPNGCGKSTSLAALAGAWPWAGGAASLGGQALAEGGCGTVGWAPQEPCLLGPTVEAELRLFAPQAPIEELARLWSHLGGPDAPPLSAPTAALMADRSGGQAARLALARALAPRPALLLLDEPLAHLDPEGRQRLLELLAEPTSCGVAVVVAHEPPPPGWEAWPWPTREGGAPTGAPQAEGTS